MKYHNKDIELHQELLSNFKLSICLSLGCYNQVLYTDGLKNATFISHSSGD